MDRHFRLRTGLYGDGVVVCSGWVEERKPTRRLSFLAAAIYTENAVVFHRLLRKPPQLLRVVNGCCGSGTWPAPEARTTPSVNSSTAAVSIWQVSSFTEFKFAPPP